MEAEGRVGASEAGDAVGIRAPGLASQPAPAADSGICSAKRHKLGDGRGCGLWTGLGCAHVVDPSAATDGL